MPLWVAASVGVGFMASADRALPVAADVASACDGRVAKMSRETSLGCVEIVPGWTPMEAAELGQELDSRGESIVTGEPGPAVAGFRQRGVDGGLTAVVFLEQATPGDCGQVCLTRGFQWAGESWWYGDEEQGRPVRFRAGGLTWSRWSGDGERLSAYQAVVERGGWKDGFSGAPPVGNVSATVWFYPTEPTSTAGRDAARAAAEVGFLDLVRVAPTTNLDATGMHVNLTQRAESQVSGVVVPLSAEVWPSQLGGFEYRQDVRNSVEPFVGAAVYLGSLDATAELYLRAAEPPAGGGPDCSEPAAITATVEAQQATTWIEQCHWPETREEVEGEEVEGQVVRYSNTFSDPQPVWADLYVWIADGADEAKTAAALGQLFEGIEVTR
ncbi:MAG: hypothetical protein LBS56_05240 [Propionibacteriaceae bacterium]|nr:hypothetical protein [Propionibacteriaceae bacterium]